ncbi:ABC-type sugar transport system permease subunit [Caldalkalibacillus uzonensis]|uniref:ABC-type sugar transport system permease subunit n=1 Tax=Caldalkalibacillus uzonensis TaxID=353224 RepID=A0ABU0CQG8_9BACI|nr:sugar ABC transporter permease [Caldalkalibacillus uzonensis]MDQ0338651.1 ABC-type sugar transport system permease subunit [Caldalkalibacillus uzonensis]
MSTLINWYQKNRIKIAPYLFISPNLILFFTFMIFPIIFTFYISFHNWAIIGDITFVGLENYVNVFKDVVFWTALGNTFYYTAGSVPISMILGLTGAVLLNRKIPLRSFFRGVFFAPVVVSLVATGLIWSWMFNPNYGLINYGLNAIGLTGLNWLSSTTWAMPAIIMTTIWVKTGYCLVIYLAGLQSIPDSIYEAAEIDGANSWKQFLYITLPLLKNTTVFVLVISVINGFMVFDLIYTMTNGGPGYSTTVLVQYIYQKAFVEGQMGYGSTVGTILFFIIMSFSAMMLWLGREQTS